MAIENKFADDDKDKKDADGAENAEGGDEEKGGFSAKKIVLFISLERSINCSARASKPKKSPQKSMARRRKKRAVTGRRKKTMDMVIRKRMTGTVKNQMGTAGNRRA